MIVCSCNVLSDTKVRDAIASGACPRTPSAVYKCLGCNRNCGRCIATLRTIINESRDEAEPVRASCGEACEIDAGALCPL